ncbi:MAG: tRNA (N(6)-L-threonylcarbamoyladenosine(37)-C(2))-methylthiotransferase MtaB [Candidatus Omnitrophota bacterium]|nr:tRNA (N(6)-L-threonylcarbamoyladenosine(37)-C(2))-methylthiotransferase MtaB [Candidatus Omnitrophota bacterium]MBU1928539.1 tRNA (N(6)-L-threonylcarbamoyladenosine(37)-C(2))-methylthiotransferase MtaB [Candidatus Omnitrophota bacterium]MBU2035002.1 tRNA (N(6)-L-threonylcarbamoyladenosine(37)-C(2))-methylthiotransferase MtaB [Candidatus Omnitrophota bacterium]MBU2221461.1 tRNA (N(6)-L-threonylcarbamoyladenosine(37)-C(2))-methylthiotransferase MtaB [Candidatus Omnitrophota bacterium]MBU225803
MKRPNPSTVLRGKGERSRNFKLITLGCKVNQYETQVIRENLIKAGFREFKDKPPADIYVINTCTVTHKADKESLYYINRSYRENPKAKIIVTGCLAELDKKVISGLKGNSQIVKNKDKYRIAGLLKGKGFNNESGITGFYKHTRAFLKIQDGCDNFCSYCKVPLVRGPSRSRPLNEIVNEAKALAKNGFKEIVLTGICLGSYGKDLSMGKGRGIDLVRVIEELEKIRRLMRIRLSSIEAGDVTDELIAGMAKSKKLCRHLHIPIQSGDDNILKAMNRKYSHQDYLGLIRKIKKTIPDIAVTTDCLVGFPGEKEDNFRNTADLVRKIMPLKVHIFPYSERKGTLAYDFKDKTPSAALRDRMIYLETIANKCALEFQRKFINKKMDVLIEGIIKDNPGFWQGYTGNYLKVMVKSPKDIKNRVLSVRLKEISRGYFVAKIMD